MKLSHCFALSIACVLIGSCDAARPGVRSGILITMDTTNASALDCYGGGEGVTPELVRLAKESVLYENARTVAPVTLPAHTSMLTGLYPLRHGVRDNGLIAVPRAALTLAERAAAEGLETAAFLSASVMAAPFGLDQGFEHYDAPGVGGSGGVRLIHERTAAEVVDLVEAWLNARDAKRPFFLWVHFFDPHYPYAAPPAQRERLPEQPYLAEVAAMDECIGRLLASLRQRGLLEQALLVALADHGEALGAHGESTHSVYCFDATMHVPLLVRHPDGRRAGERSHAPVSAVDVFPTFVDALGLGASGDIDGLSLYRADPPPERGLYFESYVGYYSYGWSPIAGWLESGKKYLQSAEPRLYDLRIDPAETHNLAPNEPALVQRARDAIRELAAKPVLSTTADVALDADLREQVRALGYAGAGDAGMAAPHPLARSELPDAHERTAEYAALHRAQALAAAGAHEAARVILEQAIAENPKNPNAYLQLGSLLSQAGRHGEAVQNFARLLALSPTLPPPQEGWIHGYIADTAERAGELEAALRHFKIGLELDPLNLLRRQRLAAVLRKLGRQEEAERVLKAGPGQ